MRIIADNLDEFRLLSQDTDAIGLLGKVSLKSLPDFTDDDEGPSVKILYDLTPEDLPSEDFDYEINDRSSQDAIGDDFAKACSEVRDNFMRVCEADLGDAVTYGELIGVRVVLEFETVALKSQNLGQHTGVRVARDVWYVFRELREECVVNKVPQFVLTGERVLVPYGMALNYYDD